MSYNQNSYDKMLQFLQKKPEARERKNKNRAIKYLLVQQYPSLRFIDAGVLESAIKTSQSIDRAWRKVLEENPDLRGSDYKEKQTLATNAQRKLGYNV